MSKRYSIADARRNLPNLVTEAEAGAEVELTRRGKPVAVLLSVSEYERMKGQRPAFGDAYDAFLKQFDLEEVGLDDGLETFARDRSTGRPVNL